MSSWCCWSLMLLLCFISGRVLVVWTFVNQLKAGNKCVHHYHSNHELFTFLFKSISNLCIWKTTLRIFFWKLVRASWHQWKVKSHQSLTSDPWVKQRLIAP
jgi:hypothetical protein